VAGVILTPVAALKISLTGQRMSRAPVMVLSEVLMPGRHPVQMLARVVPVPVHVVHV